MSIEAVARRIRTAHRVTILTGAGVSAASGVPTFRGSGGLWRQFRAEDLATPDAFRRDPALVWDWYDWRRQLIAGCVPNAAHETIAKWPVTLVTQNVDDLHLRAGSTNVVRLHGSIWDLRCAGTKGRCVPGAESWRDERTPLPELPPSCPHCGGLARPAVVWFGESLREADVAAALDACACDVFLTVGTSAIVYPAAGLVREARRRGAFTVEINPDPTPASSVVDVTLRFGAETALPEIDRVIHQA